MNSTAGKTCTACQGSGLLTSGGGPAYKCALCNGTGKAFDPGRKYGYELGPIVLAGGASLQYLSQQVLNYRFRWELAIAQFLFNFTAQILDSRDQRPFSNQQVHNLNLFGTAQNPLPLLSPFIFERNSQIQVNITDLGGGSGTVGVTNGSAAVVNTTGTGFATDGSWVGKPIVLAGVSYTILSVTDSDHLTLTQNYVAGTATVAYAVNNQIRLYFEGTELDN
ncbi:MAG: hypothetical protein ACRD20_02350 [Terriglobales bacterium]